VVYIGIDPVLFRWGTVVIGWHGLWLVGGIFAAYQVYLWQGHRNGIKRRQLGESMLWATFAAYVVARLAYVSLHWHRFAARPADILDVRQGGLTAYGAYVGILAALYAYARRKRLCLWSLADAFAMAVPVAEIVARVGCTINGDVWGMPTDGAWGVVYLHPGAVLPPQLRGVPLYPLSTMLQAWAAGLLVLLVLLRKRLRSPGSLFAICLVGYALGRLIINTWRWEQPLLLGLKGTQIVSLVVLIPGLLLLFWLRRKQVRDERAVKRGR
jgi:phosphatidylglycerol:prolipoprotein diacylglycerol transferase